MHVLPLEVKTLNLNGVYSMGQLEQSLASTFDNDKNPNNDDLPDYVVVDFPNYIGPVWNEQFKTVSYLMLIQFFILMYV